MSRNLPKTVDEAVDSLMSTMDKRALNIIKNLKHDDLSKCHNGLGKNIRNDFGLWGADNVELKKNAGKDHPDDVSAIIIEALWNKLNG